MSTHRFILEPYKGIATRHTCPECHKKRSFARYIDTEGKIEFPPYVGRCNHEQSCGYHFTPKDFFEKNPENGGIPEMARQAIRKVMWVIG